MTAMTRCPSDRNTKSRPPLRPHGRVNGLNLRVARTVLRLLRPQRRRQDDDDQVPAQPLLRPTAGDARIFGLDLSRNEVAVKSRIAYVPDTVAFYPWMTVRHALDYSASFRARWNRDTEMALLRQFEPTRVRRPAISRRDSAPKWR